MSNNEQVGSDAETGTLSLLLRETERNFGRREQEDRQGEASHAQNLATFDGSKLTGFRDAYRNIASGLFRNLVSEGP